MVRCPQCGQKHEYRMDNPARPFCSQRCRLIDLGAWAEGKYSIAGTPVDPATSGPSSVDEETDDLPLGRRLNS